ncbi:hypothetical protein [Singulisphaera sp. PoT]|uniref:hypothetical protein n=1 Tax=Singulisphaera sp. PoT TaxID=3411797 RepID=UPI003BF4897E
MNATNMIDYALGKLDDPDREQLEGEASSDPQLAESLERLTRAVQSLIDDGDPLEPPPDLARRTVDYVSQNLHQHTILELMPRSVPFRWTDFAVAASIFFASLLTLAPALKKSQERMDQAGCGFNLQQLGLSLAQYAGRHGHYPYAPPGHPNEATGSFALTLHDSELLPDTAMLDCPCNGTRHHSEPLPRLETLRELRTQSPDRYQNLVKWDYAYHAGYRQDSGKVGPVPASLSSRVPLLADQPPHEAGVILDGNSPNHGQRGQNVLFNDGHAAWHVTRRVSPLDSDLFLNEAHQARPGLDSRDAALVPSICPFTGW